MLAVVSHDAGGAELVSSWLAQSEEPVLLVLEGPAQAIFRKKFGDLELCSLSEAISASDWVLCGTSWESNLERLAIRQAKEAGKKVITYLDHWVNYRERFYSEGLFVFPDKIWVGDEEAFRVAKQQLPEVAIELHTNFYLEYTLKELELYQQSEHNFGSEGTVLYVCEPIAQHAALAFGNERHWGYTEKDAMRYFLLHLNALGHPVNSIKIRPHPSESRDKYDWAIRESTVPITIGGNRSLVEEIAEADVVVGCESMAMVVGLLAKKEVISVIPPGGRLCRLPHREIKHLQLMLKDVGK